ncbi:MAG: hypothetical protein PHI37_01535 [Candidatus Gracilibacteria bacterium]|nr:hypothetical protein [Candidatus Gracilibacteria bacterium]
MSEKQARLEIFGWGLPLPLPGGNLETLCKENHEASCLYTEYTELCKTRSLTFEQQERKKQIIAILQQKIAAMKERKETERRIQEEIANAKLAGIFPA